MICSSLLHVLDSFMDMVPIMLGDWLVIWLCANPKNALLQIRIWFEPLKQSDKTKTCSFFLVPNHGSSLRCTH
jgi:hypothetical protein